jgi:hypothetical protein
MFHKCTIYVLLILLANDAFVKAQSSSVNGFYWLSWEAASTSKMPANTNLCACFSGWISIREALRDCANVKVKLSQFHGKKYLSFGGGNKNGRWTLAALINLDSGIKSKQLAGWNGIVYDIEEGDSGLAAAFATSFATAKANGLGVLVTVSHSQPYAVSDAPALMKSFFSNSNIDYLSPQLYTTGSETKNDYTDLGTSWKAYAAAKAKIVPSVVLGSRDFPTAKTYFTKFGIKLAGFMQWAQRKSFSNFSQSNVEIVN